MKKAIFGVIAGLVLGITVTAGIDVVRGQSNDSGIGVVPDMEQIYNSALNNMFDAAGEKFTDPELKAFYERLTGEITESLATPVPYDPGLDAPEATPTPVPTPEQSADFWISA